MPDFSPRSAQSRAPACLDVMGGVSDYSGGLCLQWLLENATICRVTPHDKPTIIARSDAATANGWNEIVELSLDELSTIFPDNARQKFPDRDAWALHVIGVLVMLQWQIGWAPPCGMAIEIVSNVPIGAGISSSAALEIAVVSAINRAFKLQMDEREIAQWARLAETQIIGAPADIRGQITALRGRKNHLIQIKCQPDLVEDFIAPPDGIEFWGIGAGAPQSDGVAYNRARCAAMMGRALLARLISQAMRGPDGELYLANVSTDVWRALRPQIPERMSGADFGRDYGNTDVDPDTIYPLRLATEHPIYEADRVARFARLLRQMDENPAARAQLGRAAGELMIQSHFSYDHRCKMGNRETDSLVELARQAGVENGIYGARITGQGAGGTVALMGDRQLNPNLDETIEQIAASYAQQSGRNPQIFRGSSDGANVHF